MMITGLRDRGSQAAATEPRLLNKQETVPLDKTVGSGGSGLFSVSFSEGKPELNTALRGTMWPRRMSLKYKFEYSKCPGKIWYNF